MYTDIKTFEDACNALDVIPQLPDLSAIPEKYRKAIIAHYMLVVIVEALNEGWKPDWNNPHEYKYYPWFDMSNGFRFNGSDGLYRSGSVGSRLCFRSRELAQYAGTQFTEVYKDYFTI